MRALFVITLAIAIVLVSVNQTGAFMSKTKIPYNNGFYAGPYNPKLPVIDPTAK